MQKDFGPFLKIMLRFIIIYLVLLFAYQFYLNYYIELGLDPISRSIAKQVQYVQNILGYTTTLDDVIQTQRIRYLIHGKVTTAMVEGCNAVSIMIMFVAFVFAFYKGFKTFVFVFLGLLALHIMNVLRIAGLNIVYFDKPEYGKMFHDYVFPALIYGSVVVLWLIWIKFFALKNEK